MTVMTIILALLMGSAAVMLLALRAQRGRADRAMQSTLAALSPVVAVWAGQMLARQRRDAEDAVAAALAVQTYWMARLQHQQWQRDAADAVRLTPVRGTYDRHLALRARQPSPAAGRYVDASVPEQRRADAAASSSLLDDAVLAGALTATSAWHVYDWYHLDDRVAEAASRYANTEISNNSDLWAEAQEWGNLDGVITGLRGHIGEQEAARLLEQAGLNVEFAAGGSNPGWDLDIEGVQANVKIVTDANSLAEHFAKYPDIPVIVNSDAANLPESAIRFDPDRGIDPDLLIGENRVLVVEGLTLQGTAETAQEAVNAASDGVDVGDALPGLSLLSAAVTSAYREGRLLHNGDTDWARAARNVAVDVGTRGTGGVLGGVAAGAAAGAAKGLVVDAGAGGATFGAATAVMTVLGAIGGAKAGGEVGSHIKTKELRAAQVEASTAFTTYAEQVERVHSTVSTLVEEAQQDARRQLRDALDSLNGGRLRDLNRVRNRLREQHLFDARDVIAQVDATLTAGLRGRDRRFVAAYAGPGRYLDLAADDELHRWRRRAARAGIDAGHGNPQADGRLWDVLCEVPGTEQLLARHLDQVHAQRHKTLAEHVGRSTTRGAAAAQRRRDAQAHVHRAHDRAVRDGRHNLAPHARRLEAAHRTLRAECSKAGLGT